MDMTRNPGRLLKFLLLVLLAFVEYACEEPVDPGIEIREPELVVSSTFFPDDVVKVRLSATQPTGGELLITDIFDATVEILEGDELVESLVYVSGHDGRPGNYQGDAFRPQVGRIYTLLATRNGYVPFEAESSIPVATPITELKGEIVSTTSGDNLTIYDFDLIVNYEDPVFEENFYDLRISQLVIPYYINSGGDTVRQDARAKIVQSPTDAVSGNAAMGEASILVRDRPNGGGVQTRLQSRLDLTKEILGRLEAELRTVSPAYYYYHLAFRREGQALPIGLGDPPVNINAIGNASSGVGIFGGYNSVRQRIALTF
jgi:hypothetical protein